MADQMWGADVDQLDALARDLTAAAERLESLSGSLGGRIGSVPWSGRDATSFRHDWQGRHASTLRAVREAMRSAASTVTANAAEQRHASQSLGGQSLGGQSLGGQSLGESSSRSTAGRVVHDLRQGAGVVGDVAGVVQVAADGTAVVAGGIAAAGLFVPGVGWAGSAVAAGVAETSVDVAEVSGVVSMAGHWIADPNDPDLGEQVNTEMATGGLAGPDGVAAVDGLYGGVQGLTGDLMEGW